MRTSRFEQREGLQPEAFLWIGNEARIPTATTLCSVVLGVLATTFRQEKQLKGIQIRDKEVKLSLFTDNMILYMENPKDYTHKNC